MYQYYVVEIQTHADGSFGHLVHWAYDEDADKARLKGESKFYEVLAAAAVSELPVHSAIMFSTEGFPIMHQCYKHTVVPEPTPDTTPVEPTEPEETEEPQDVSSLFN